MPIRQRRYPKAEFAGRGNAIYERDMRGNVHTKALRTFGVC